MATEVGQSIIRMTSHRVFKDHKSSTIVAISVFPDGHRMVTGSSDKMLRLWDLKNGAVLKTLQGHRSMVQAVAVSRDGRSIASGGMHGEVIVWDGDSGESLTQAIKVHSQKVTSLDFSPDGGTVASVSWDKTIELCTRQADSCNWDVQGNPITSGEKIFCVRYAPSGGHLAIATANDIQIWDPSGSAPVCIAKFRAVDISAWHVSLAWMPDGTRLFTAGSRADPVVREWDTSTWNQVESDWCDHTDYIRALAVNPTGTLVASASLDTQVRIWSISDRRTISIFKAVDEVYSVTFSTDGKYILCGGRDVGITELTVPSLVETPNLEYETLLTDAPEKQASDDAPDSYLKVFSIKASVHDACVTRNLSAAQELLTQQIGVDRNNHNSYANRSFVLSLKRNWDAALHDALTSINILPTLAGYVSRGIALCGRMQFDEAMKSFDLAFMFTDGKLNTILMLLLVKATALFNANRHQEAILHVQELATACPKADTLACHVVEAYLRTKLGINALNDAHPNEAADHFTSAVNTGVFLSTRAIHPKYDVFAVLFGWDMDSLWKTASQNLCHALLQAGRLSEAHEAYRHMMDQIDETTKASCLIWSTAFKQECMELYAANGVTDLIASGNAALASTNYDRAIELYSAEINLNSAIDTIFARRCKAKLGKNLWEEALLDAQKVIEFKPSSYLGYHLKHAALHGAQRYDEAIEALELMTSKWDDAPDTPTYEFLHRRTISRSEAEDTVQKVIDARVENAPPRLINTVTGRLCNRDAQINCFKASAEYKSLLSLTMRHTDLRLEHFQDAVLIFFQYAMLSHRWGNGEPLLHNVEGKNVYDLNPIDGIPKLQSFCKVARDRGYRWAWSDTCCIDKTNNIDLQASVNSMFTWYRHSALTIVYLSDVPASSRSGALARSAWNKRGWTVQEFLAPGIVLFFQADWSLYLDDRSLNHKESAVIMQELADATGINTQALTAFRPEMKGAREKLQWSSMRVTTLQEDIAYSLFGIFGVHLAPIYGEKKQNALGRLLQEIIAQSGDITSLDWVGKSSEFNSCLPANITAYAAPPFLPPSLSGDEMRMSVSLLLGTAKAVELASQLCTTLEDLSAPRFAQRRLHLPCIIFTVTEIALRPDQEQETNFTYVVKVDGLYDLLVTTEDKLVMFSHTSPIRRKFLLIRPWDRNLLELRDFAEPSSVSEHVQSIIAEGYQTAPSSPQSDFPDISPEENVTVDSEPDAESRALRLIVHLGQPFRGFLLAQHWGGEYKRIAADHDIIAHVEDKTSVESVCGSMDVRMLEIL